MILEITFFFFPVQFYTVIIYYSEDFLSIKKENENVIPDRHAILTKELIFILYTLNINFKLSSAL